MGITWGVWKILHGQVTALTQSDLVILVGGEICIYMLNISLIIEYLSLKKLTNFSIIIAYYWIQFNPSKLNIKMLKDIVLIVFNSWIDKHT